MRGTRGMGGMSSNIPGKVLKHSGKCPEIIRGMSQNISGNVATPKNVVKHFGECSQKSREYRKQSGACCKTSCGKYESVR